MNVLKNVRFAARLAVFVAILLGALSSAIVAPSPAQADKGKEEPTLILLFGAEESLQEAGKVISEQIEAVDLFRSYPKEYLQEFANGEESEAGHLYRVIGDASFDDVVKQLQAVIEGNEIQDVAIEAENLAPLFYVPGEILLTGPEGELEQIAQKHGLQLIGEKITISRERTKSQQGAQNLQFAAYQIADGTVQEVVTSINELKSNVSSSPNLLTTRGSGEFYVACGGGDDPYIFRNGNHPLSEWDWVSPAIPSNVQKDYEITGKGVRIAVLDNVHPELEKEPLVNGVGINVWSGTSWSPLPEPNSGNNDPSSHGVFVAGLAHAMAPDAEIHLLPVLNEEGVGDLATLIHAIHAFTEQVITDRPENGAVINLSLTIEASHLPQDFSTSEVDTAMMPLNQAIANAYAAKIPIVAAAGNDFQKSHPYLADLHPNIISVGANYRHETSCFSNSGMVYAPGGGRGTANAGNPSSIDCSNDGQVNYLVNSCSLYGPDQDNCVRSWVWDATNGWVIGAGAGTSFSAPQVTGLVALYLQNESWDTPSNVGNAILSGATGSAYITQCGTNGTNTSSGISTPIAINMPSCGIMNVQNTLGIPIGSGNVVNPQK